MSASLRRNQREASPGEAATSRVSALTRAVELFQSGAVAEALALLKPLRAGDLDAGQCALVGLIYLGSEADQEALRWFDEALDKGQAPEGLLAHRALALQRTGRPREAILCYEQATAAGALDATGYYHRGNLMRDAGDREAAIASYDAALQLNPAYAEALYAGGSILFEAGQLQAALEFFDEVLRLKPEFCQAWFSRGNVLQKQMHLHDALSAYDAALALAPGHPDILANRGVALYELARHAEALACYEAALRTRPDFPQVLLNRGNVFLRLRKPDLALLDCEAALKLKPDYLEALCSRGVALRDLGHIEESIAAFDMALSLAPDFAHARNNRGAAYLLLGDFERGLEDYEFRWVGGETAKRDLKLPLPEWSGTVRPGEHILVFDEQGFGDAIQFSRYLPLLVKAGAKVTFFCRRKLHRLLSTLSPQIQLIDTIAKASDFDCQIALSSLPFVCGTRLETVPSAVPYLFAEAQRCLQWENRIGQAGFKIGLCWHGNQDARADPSRSIPLELFAPLASLEDVRLLSLQVGAGSEQLDGLPASMRIEQLGADFDAGADAFLDAAAAMQAMDLIVTCDTSIAHLAGALGRPVWLLLKPYPDWRWLLGRDDSPWYPTMKLFRRRLTEDWAELIMRMKVQLMSQIKTPRVKQARFFDSYKAAEINR